MNCCVVCYSDEDCRAVNFQEASQTCELNDRGTFYDDNDTGGDWIIYRRMEAATIGEICSKEGECNEQNTDCVGKIERTQICVCEKKHEFDKENHVCKKVCETFASTFTLHRDKDISDFRFGGGLDTYSVEECREHCLSRGDKCPAFILKTNGKCILKKLSMQMALEAGFLIDKNGANLYDRDCEA